MLKHHNKNCNNENAEDPLLKKHPQIPSPAQQKPAKLEKFD